MKGKCFNCHKPRNFANKCPRLHSKRSNAQANVIIVVLVVTMPPPRDTGRAALKDNILILKNEISTLLDLGASHTFVSLIIVKALNMKTENTTNPLIVSNLIGGSNDLSVICKDLVLDISNVDFICNAYILGFEGYGFILGMD